MKKIYMILAAMVLLTLSLNAQLLPSAQKTLISNNKSFREVPSSFKAPNAASLKMMNGKTFSTSPLRVNSNAPLRANLGEGEYILGPYTSDAYDSSGWGLTSVTTVSSAAGIMIGVDMELSEYQDYLGDEIVGYRFATIGTAYIYEVFVLPMSEQYLSTDNMIEWSLSDDEGYPTTYSTSGWHEVRLDTPVEFNFPDSIVSFWLGYQYYQATSSSSLNKTPVAYNSNSTSHMDRMYWNSGFYNVSSYVGGDIAVQLIMKHTDTTPVLTAPENNSTVNVGTNYGTGVSKTINIKGENLTQDLTVSVTGAGFSVSRDVTVTAAEANAGQDITVTYNGTVENATGTLTVSSSEVSATVSLTASYYAATIGDGTLDLFDTTSYVAEVLPVYGYWYDRAQHNQMIYPASLLTEMIGTNLTSMTFYPATYTDDYYDTYSGINFYEGSVTFSLTEVNSSTGFDSSSPSPITGTMTPVATVTPVKDTSATTWLIEFDDEYEYHGGDLVIDVTTTTGQYGTTYFYVGTTSSLGLAYPGYLQYTSTYALNFVPRVTFTYEAPTTDPTVEITPEEQTINDAAAGSLTITGENITGNINVSAADNDWTVNPTSLGNTGGNVNVTYTGRDLSATTTVTATAANDNTVTDEATVNYVADLYIVTDNGVQDQWDFNNGTHMTYDESTGTYTARFIATNANTYILFARLLGNSNPWNTRDVFGPSSSGDWWMDADQKNGTIDVNDDDPIYFPNGGTYTITIYSDGTFTITKLTETVLTDPPTITYTVSDDGYVTITATGEGTVTLNVPGYDPVIGENGEASLTIPCGYVSNTITVTATAKGDDKEESNPASAQVIIPASSDWIEMDGTYDNPNDMLSFQKDGEDIMLIDQFLESTLLNEQPDHYTYTLRQTVNGETSTSTPVTIPVYKTDSKMMGLYTYNQVMGDTDMKLKPNVFNTEMDFDVNPDRNVLYYSLYRGDKNTTYPEIKAESRISQLQKYQENIGDDNVQFYFYESHQNGVVPRYQQSDHIGSQVVERLDTNWVEGDPDDMLPYVPVIWTYGLYTARGDGKNNSYGSDIKREYMGKVTANITGQISKGDFGTWEDNNGTTYRAFHPTIVATGYLPQNGAITYNDEDQATYVPFLCRAWCTNEGIHDYGRDADGHLEDRGELPTPFLLGEATFGSDMTATIGGDWTEGSVRDPWSFGLPATVTESQVTFKIRFYYKKVVTEGQQNGGNGKFIGGAAEEFFMAETEGDANDMIVGINEFMNGIVPVSVTYVNPQGMQSSRPFDGVNIVVTRYSDGTTRTSKVIR